MEEAVFRIAILAGSARVGRESHKIALYLEQILQEQSVSVNLIDLKETPLPIMDERYNFIEHTNPTIHFIADALQKADGVIFISPEYTGSISGVLKNAIDFFARIMTGKPIGVVATSNGKLGGITASHQIQQIILSMNSYPMPYKLLVKEIKTAFDENLQPAREDIIKDTQRFVNEFVPFAKAIHTMKLAKNAGT